ncbi:transcription/translation regulatory transformer protein RfaH [Vibrio pelagius]|uniref:transcription/translation regulatory transformer protein RfaH n=1 Tax=Vibrio pelagius TaxID=28169 RepID=UPI0035528F77
MKRWYLLYCKRGEQLRAKQHMENQGVECFYPQLEVEKIVRGKKKRVKEPLFPSYIFVRFDYEQGPSFTTLRSTRGVVDFIKFGAMPHEVQGDLIYELKQIEQECQGYPVDDCPQLCSDYQAGDVVEICSGQFAGIKAVYHEKDGEARSIMLVQMISQVVPVSIENAALAARI